MAGAVQGRDDEGLGQGPGEVDLAPLHILDLPEVPREEGDTESGVPPGAPTGFLRHTSWKSAQNPPF